MSRTSLRSICAFFLLLSFAATAHADWPLNGSPVVNALNSENEPCSVADGSGGVIVGWVDNRSGNNDIYAQRLNAQGVPQWTTDGVVICNSNDNQFRLDICSDGAGGAILTWSDYRTNGVFADIYVQRVNSAGVPQWTANGVIMVNDPTDQFEPKIVADGSGGAIVVWTDPRSGSYDTYARRVNSAGAPQWTANGVALCTSTGDQRFPRIVSDNAGGAIVAWRDARAGAANLDIYARRVDSAGTAQWTANGVGICTVTGNQDNHQLIADGSGGAIITWDDARVGGQTDIVAQRVNASGTALWQANGQFVCFDGSVQNFPTLTTDGAGGAIIAWQDNRVAGSDIYVRRVAANGNLLWTSQGVLLGGATSTQGTPVCLSDGAGGAFVAWKDLRAGTFDIYVRRVNASGAPMWTTDGVPLCVANDDQGALSIVSNGAGGAIVTWSDFRNGVNYDLFSQRVEGTYGYYGYPEPVVTAVADIRYDQGGKVKVNWTASGRDRGEPRTIGSYSIWRAVDVAPAAALTAGITDVAHTDTKRAGRVFASAAGYYWELVGTQNAFGFGAYTFSADTRADSVLANQNNEVFMVAAHVATDNFIAFQSNSVTGHSVDNLAPTPPLALIAQRVGANVNLKWNGVHVQDLQNYALYRKTSTGVTPIPINFLSNSIDTVYTDASAPGSALYYIVTARDVHTNESNASNEAAVAAVTGVGDTPAINGLSVLQNRPNPFTAGTELQIGLPHASRVDIAVYDIAGKRVRSMTLKDVPAGWKRVSFDGRDNRGNPLASGVYFYRVSAAGKTITNKMVIAR